MLTCAYCTQNELPCACGMSHLCSSVSADLLPAAIENETIDGEHIVAKSLIKDRKTFGDTIADQSLHRQREKEHLETRKYCETTGRRSLDEALALGDERYHHDGVPTPEEHMSKQGSLRGLPIYGRQYMYEPHPQLGQDSEIEAKYIALYRHALNPSCEKPNKVEGYTSDSLNLNIVMFNMGNLAGRPYACGKKKLTEGTETLTRLLFNNAAHIAGTREAGMLGPEKHDALVKEYNRLCVKVESVHSATAVACVMKGKSADGASIQLISRSDSITQNKENHTGLYTLPRFNASLATIPNTHTTRKQACASRMNRSMLTWKDPPQRTPC